MGKDTEPRLPQQPPPGQFPNAEFSKPPFGYSGFPILEPQPDGCFYRFPKIDLCGKFPTAVNNVCGDAKTPIASIGCVPKQFLVFDQTGNKTTIILSSLTPNPTGFGNPREGKVGIMSKVYNNCGGPMLTDESDDDRVTNEDSEEIDALLYSDDGEEEEDTDEVTSSFCPPLKRQKHSDRSLDYDKIRETVSFLQTIIPGMNGGTNDAVMVIDEAIEYLRTLKFKAKSLGLSALSIDRCGKS